MLAGETYEESAAREAKEELGITNAPLKGHFDFYFEDERNRVWGRVFSCICDGPFALQEEEIESEEFRDLENVLQERVKPLTPDTLLALFRYLQNQARP